MNQMLTVFVNVIEYMGSISKEDITVVQGGQ